MVKVLVEGNDLEQAIVFLLYEQSTYSEADVLAGVATSNRIRLASNAPIEYKTAEDFIPGIFIAIC